MDENDYKNGFLGDLVAFILVGFLLIGYFRLWVKAFWVMLLAHGAITIGVLAIHYNWFDVVHLEKMILPIVLLVTGLCGALFK